MMLSKRMIYVSFITCVSCSVLNKHKSAEAPYLRDYNVQRHVIAKSAGVTCAHPLASKAGLYILKRGGNAIDAAIAMQLALAVVYPQAGNIGGGGFMVMRLHDGIVRTLDYRERAPLLAHRNMFLDEQGNPDDRRSLAGHLASGVPGTMAGIAESLSYANLPLSVLIQPAIDLAEQGYIITSGISDEIPFVDPSLNTRPNIFDGSVKWKTGDTIKQPELAATLKRIRAKGCREFYEGKTARLIVEEMQRGGGMISAEDLKEYKAVWRNAHSFNYRGYTIYSMPLPSSGGIILNQMLKMVEPFPLSDYGYGSVYAISICTEAERISYRNRAMYLGDDDFADIPINKLVNEQYLKTQMKDYDHLKAGVSKALDMEYLQQESMETTHLSVVDNQGNSVSVTTTLNMAYGSQVIVGGAGFILNNEMNDFSLKPGTYNASGGVGGIKNAIAPGKRMLSSMSPAIVVKDNELFMVLGSPGGTTIPTSVFQTIVNVIDFKMSLTAAVDSPKFHHEWLPDILYMEAGFPDSVKNKLCNMGYSLQERSLGRVEAILKTAKGNLEIVADKRGVKDSAEGY